VRPKNFSRRFAEELPIPPCIVCIDEADRPDGILDLGGQQIAVLITDVARRSFQVNVDPSAPFETIRLSQARVGRTTLCEPTVREHQD
jgi:hypothetical protein